MGPTRIGACEVACPVMRRCRVNDLDNKFLLILLRRVFLCCCYNKVCEGAGALMVTPEKLDDSVIDVHDQNNTS
jgi:hypothetical protein